MPNYDALKNLVLSQLPLPTEEDSRLQVYDDATGKTLHPGMTLVGHPTIGVGRALDTNGISKQEQFYLLGNDVDKALETLTYNLSWFDTLDTVRQSILVKMTFILGGVGLLNFHDMLSALRAGNYEKAATEMMNSKWAKQEPNRAKQYAELMRTAPVPPVEAPLEVSSPRNKEEMTPWVGKRA